MQTGNSFFQRKTKNENICWVNVCEEGFNSQMIGLSVSQLKKKFHVTKNNTEIFSGGYVLFNFGNVLQALNG